MLFHGYGGSKIGLAAMHRWLDHGYAIFSMTDRGFHESCGIAASTGRRPRRLRERLRPPDDTRYEVRDAQYFAGRLADEGLSTRSRSARPAAPTAAASRWRWRPCKNRR